MSDFVCSNQRHSQGAFEIQAVPDRNLCQRSDKWSYWRNDYLVGGVGNIDIESDG